MNKREGGRKKESVSTSAENFLQPAHILLIFSSFSVKLVPTFDKSFN